MNSVFLSRPHQLEQKLRQWLEDAGDYIKVDYELSYRGHKVYGLTFSDWSVPSEKKIPVYVAQPHAHEPASIAGIIDVIEQMACGRKMNGDPTQLDIDRILSQLIVTFNPIGNPDGSERAPYDVYDGTKITNDELWCIMRGEDPDNPGKMWGRFDVFDIREHKVPNPMGIVYEPVDDFRYVEPNRSQLSSYFRLFRRMDAQFHYRYWINLHQTEFVNSDVQCCNYLPLEGATSEEFSKVSLEWAEEVTDAWRKAGYKVAAPTRLPYKGIQREYFLQNWGPIDKRLYRITTEVKNNGLDFPAIDQLTSTAIAIVTTLHRLSK